jgi:hypothetical protein
MGVKLLPIHLMGHEISYELTNYVKAKVLIKYIPGPKICNEPSILRRTEFYGGKPINHSTPSYWYIKFVITDIK